jgi:hypothetical protein
MNFLTPHRYQSTYATSFTVNAFLAEVEKWTQPVPDSVSEARIKEGGL